jgi:hypothetical protein
MLCCTRVISALYVHAMFMLADIPKALLGAAIIRDRVRPAWPGTASSSCGYPGATTWHQQQQQQQQRQQQQGLDAEVGSDDDVQPPREFRRLAEACWAHEPQDRYEVCRCVLGIHLALTKRMQMCEAAATWLTAWQSCNLAAVAMVKAARSTID